jgi:putative N-acetylmannosamine-6-phosphate epimerase
MSHQNGGENIEIDEKVLEAVKNVATEGRLSCGQAEKLAEELGVKRMVIGQACDRLKIKIKGCQLGCF